MHCNICTYLLETSKPQSRNKKIQNQPVVHKRGGVRVVSDTPRDYRTVNNSTDKRYQPSSGGITVRRKPTSDQGTTNSQAAGQSQQVSLQSRVNQAQGSKSGSLQTMVSANQVQNSTVASDVNGVTEVKESDWAQNVEMTLPELAEGLSQLWSAENTVPLPEVYQSQSPLGMKASGAWNSLQEIEPNELASVLVSEVHQGQGFEHHVSSLVDHIFEKLDFIRPGIIDKKDLKGIVDSLLSKVSSFVMPVMTDGKVGAAKAALDSRTAVLEVLKNLESKGLSKADLADAIPKLGALLLLKRLENVGQPVQNQMKTNHIGNATGADFLQMMGLAKPNMVTNQGFGNQMGGFAQNGQALMAQQSASQGFSSEGEGDPNAQLRGQAFGMESLVQTPALKKAESFQTFSLNNMINNEISLDNLAQEKVMQAIDKNASMLIRNNGGQLKVQLNPHNLGSIDLLVDVKNGNVSLEMAVESNEVKELIKSKAAELKSRLAASDLKMTGLDLSIRQSSDSNGTFTNRDSQNQNQSKNQQQSRDFSEGSQRDFLGGQPRKWNGRQNENQNQGFDFEQMDRAS